ncbi:kinase D-interacting substrate of 220 kDa B isoform X3 [Neodiprion fabricii]|uniref:kinase D-interacting substrate of 220 kDa B isoform X3 n=1 Tax=Neodiprion fabricii TaxID=2872261 RepID=UPI001ED922C1|nr:kinase D-interacting substrate of 220 kDa B isoform X3 [Neodiprion fabricii]
MIRYVGDGVGGVGTEGLARRHSSNVVDGTTKLSDRDGILNNQGSVATNVRRKRHSFLHLHLPEHQGWSASNLAGGNQHHHTFASHLSHFHVPTLTFTAPAADGTGRKFSFGIRRHSHTTLHRSDSMVSLCYRSIVNFITDDNLLGLQNFLENKRVQVDDRDENGSTALIYAASKGKIHFVRELINHGADVNVEDGDDWTALLCAAKEGYTDVCLELLEHGAQLEHRDMGGWSALMWATYKGRSETVSLLLSRGADVNAHGNYHISSLLWAAGRGYADILKDLIAHGAKVNVGDKYGTSALVWSCRKGNIEIVDALLKAGANVDTAGMYSWTALLVATLGNHVDVVMLLLEYKPNVNALDKDGCTALAIACREGHHEIANALVIAGAYINIQDRAGDTNLIHAVKGGHRGVVETLIKKYADVDIAGKDKKTAIYIAVEKGNVAMVKLLLTANPDLEIPTKDGDTPLLRAVRSRNAEIVQLLLDKKAKVSAADKKGDTVLHIAMRARSKAIVEILLRNPKNSQLLYRPNRQGETPYNIDINHPKTILGQIFGARRLNTNEDNENMLGYDLYSSALADILSEPSLSTPITVGLYAKWGSGKSFLLNKLREEMKNFARQWMDPVFQFSSLLFLVVVHVSLLIGVILGLSLQSWIIGLAIGVTFIVVLYVFLLLVWYANQRYDWYWPYNFNVALTRKLNNLKLLLQVMFCHPPGAQVGDSPSAQPTKFYFTDQTRVGTTSAGENAVVQMVGSLYDSIENDYGSLVTRLYRAFRPKMAKSTSSWKWRHVCCLPYIVIFEICFGSLLVGVSILTVYLIEFKNSDRVIEQVTAHAILLTVGLLLSVGIIANLYTWSRMLHALVFSQRRHLQRSISKLETLKSEGFIQTLRSEVNLMTEMVKCLDRFTSQQSRLVVVVDGLDSCEQDKVLLVLDAIQALFSDNHCPFIVILAIDPHVIAKAVEVNSRRLFTESNIGGHDYLRNMVHLPFYLQNSGLRKLKVAQQTAQYHKKSAWTEAEDSINYATTSAIHHSVSNRRLSTESGVMNSTEKLKPPSRKNSRKLRLSESVASSIGSNLNRLGGAHDLNKMLLTDDYFSDVNPRSMRRLMNVVYVTGRLLKAFQIDFNWYHLASWINITEQWPFRTSWMILHYDLYEETLDDSTSLKALYDKVRPQIPVLKDVQPLLEMDRDERKLDVFLTFHRSSLLISDMKIFLPFTINLDPYIKKKIKEEQQVIDEESMTSGMYKPAAPWNNHVNHQEHWPPSKSVLTNRQHRSSRGNNEQRPLQPGWVAQSAMDWQPPPWVHLPPMEPAPRPISAITSLPPDILEMKLSSLSVNGVCDLLGKVEELSPAQAARYKNVIRENNISGRVLLHCDLQELKKVLKMGFGDWELFRIVIASLREAELSSFTTHEEGPRSVRFTVGSEQITRKEPTPQNVSSRPVVVEKDKSTSRTDGSSRRDPSKQSVMEKQYQVTLEEQMICGALQTLNEEACEDVLDVPSPATAPTDSLPERIMEIRMILGLFLMITAASGWNVTFESQTVTVHMHEALSVAFTANVTEADVANGTVVVSTTRESVATVDDLPVLDSSTVNDLVWSSNLVVSGNFLGNADILLSIVSPDQENKTSDALSVIVIREERIIDTLFTVFVAVMVSIMYINFGAAMDWPLCKRTLKRPIGPTIGFVCQFIWMPLLSYGIGLVLFPDDPELRLGMFFAGVSPAGGASNIWTVILGGNLNLSVTMTTISTLAAFGMMPLWIFTLGSTIFNSANLGVPYSRIAMFAVGLVIPLGIGFLIQKKLPRVSRILIIVAGIGLPWLGYLFGYLLALVLRQPGPDITAISVETGVQNTGISIFLLRFSLPQPAADLTTIAPVSVAIMTPIPLTILWIVKLIMDRRKKSIAASAEKLQGSTVPIPTVSASTKTDNTENP